MPTQWEYKLEGLSGEARAITQRLDDESAEGWDLVTVLPAADEVGGDPTQRLVFRREVTNPTWDH